jgi:hypothetical protein
MQDQEDIRIVPKVLPVELVPATIEHTTVHTVLKQVVKEQENQMEQDLVWIVISASMVKVAEKGHIAYSYRNMASFVDTDT